MTRHDPKLIAKLARQELERRKRLVAMKGECEQDLLCFVREFWKVLEPETPFMEFWPLEVMCDALMAVTDGHIKRLIMNVPPGFCKSLLLNVFFPAWLWGPCNMPWLRFISASYAASLTERDNGRFRRLIADSTYQKLWGDRVKVDKDSVELVENNRTGWKRAISVGGALTGQRGDYILCDDVNNPYTVESDVVRASTNMWLTEVMPDRLNNLDQGVIINIQQRTHLADATATLAEHWRDFAWVCIPMEFDPLRIGRAVLRREADGTPIETWVDPRSLDENGNELEGLYTNEKGELKVRMGSPMAHAEGDLAWPERFSPQAVDDMKRIKAAYAWCNPGEAPVLMGDLSLRRIDQVKVGDKIVGFELGSFKEKRRARLKPATVLSISKSYQPVVKITLNSGNILRCTRDHKWWTGRANGISEHRQIYAPALAPGEGKRPHKTGSVLSRVCPAHLPVLTNQEDLRTAGWLAGFFDGEGTVSLMRRDGSRSNAIVQFSQSCERNLPLCDKLEWALHRLGFSFGYKEIKRGGGWQKVRIYWLSSGKGKAISNKGREHSRGNRLEIYQRFLHVVQPNKWRERLITATINGRLFTEGERVVSIEKDGFDTVYGLETTTGNYVVWGLASSNSGQYMQMPTVRGGGVIRRDWWQLWAGENFPELGTVVASLDTAYEEGQENDYNALTTWGAFPGKQGEPQIILTSFWKARLPLAQLCARVAETCNERKVDYLLIEHKSRGRDVHDEIRRIYMNAPWQTILVPCKGSKESRLNAVSELFSGPVRKDPVSGTDVWTGGMIFAPDKAWADDLITEIAEFPRGKFDDGVDSTTMALSWMRKNGVVLRKTEYEDIELERRKFRRTQPVPYAIRG